MMRIKQIHYGDEWPINLHWTEDPVRPELNREFRYTAGREVFTNGGAIICIAYCRGVPSMVTHLNTMVGLDHAVFYTVWSRNKGSGRVLVNDVWSYLQMTRPWIKRYVTLSPKTKMAFNFHIKNGATLLRENIESDNYEYEI
jgi:hypothetical protein